MSQKQFDLTYHQFSVLSDFVMSRCPSLSGKYPDISSGYRPNDISGDHKAGYAIDITYSDRSNIFWFWLTCVKHWEIVRSMGVRKCFLSLHNSHVHLSFRPDAPLILGYETYNGGPKNDPTSYPIPRYDGVNSDFISALSRYEVVQSYAVDYLKNTTVVSTGCAVLLFVLFFLTSSVFAFMGG